MADKKLTLAQKIFAIQNEVGTIAKKGTNTFQKYSFAREVDFTLALLPLFSKYKVFMVMETVIPPQVMEMGKQYLTTATFKFKYINSEDVTDYIESVVPGQGSDNGDKGVYKAITGAKKYSYATTFMIATDDDPEKTPAKGKSTRGTKLAAVPTEDF